METLCWFSSLDLRGHLRILIGMLKHFVAFIMALVERVFISAIAFEPIDEAYSEVYYMLLPTLSVKLLSLLGLNVYLT